MAHDLEIIIDRTKSLAEAVADANDKAREVDTLLENDLYSGNESKAHEDLEAWQDVLGDALTAIEGASEDVMNL